MTDQLFDRAVVFTDIHFGEKQNSRQHNIDCENFVEWMIDEAKQWGADTCIFMGDWHHDRARINASTLMYSISNIEKLNNAFKDTYFIVGNHDIYYRDKREVNSVYFSNLVDNVHLINDPIVMGDCAFVPWLVGDEWKQIQKLKAKYCFGHFELPHFKMNAMVEMPDHGTIKLDHFGGFEKVFTGHFHKRQIRDNIIYTGNCFPHNFSDAEDDERGLMFLEWDKQPIFKKWPGAPKYRKTTLSQLLENAESIMDNQTFVRAEIDVFLNYEDANYVKDVLIKHYNPRDLSLVPRKNIDPEIEEFSDDINFASVDSVVLTHLSTIKSPNIRPELLTEIYRQL